MFFSNKLIELNYELGPDSLAWPTQPGLMKAFKKTPYYEGFTKEGYWYASYKICTPEHIGTHIDAPSHFSERGLTVDEIPLKNLMFVPAVVIDIRKKVKKNIIYQLTAKDVVEWVEEYGLFPNNSVVLVLTGWSSRYQDKVAYFGHATDPKKFIFPGVGVDAVQTILGYRNTSGINVVGIGLDTPSIDYGPSQIFRSHQEVAQANVYVLENLKNIESLQPKGMELMIVPLKLKGGSGSPCRVFARPQSSDISESDSNGCKDMKSNLLLPFILLIVILRLYR